jgi:hypothetical protein
VSRPRTEADRAQRQIQWYTLYSEAARANHALNRALLAVRATLADVEAERDRYRGQLALAEIKINKVKELVR